MERPIFLRVSFTRPTLKPADDKPRKKRQQQLALRNAREEGLRNASKYHDIGTPRCSGHPCATSSEFLFVLGEFVKKKRTKRKRVDGKRKKKGGGKK